MMAVTKEKKKKYSIIIHQVQNLKEMFGALRNNSTTDLFIQDEDSKTHVNCKI